MDGIEVSNLEAQFDQQQGDRSHWWETTTTKMLLAITALFFFIGSSLADEHNQHHDNDHDHDHHHDHDQIGDWVVVSEWDENQRKENQPIRSLEKPTRR